MVSAPRCRPGARGLLALLLLLLLPLPGARGQCGTLPTLSRAVPGDTSRTDGFPIGTEVTYKCSDGFVKIPGKSDTVVCLSNSEWSTIGEFCNGGCGATPRLKSATLIAEDAKKNYCPPGTTVSYVCRPGYEETELRPVITCLENSTWSEAPEFCRKKSCGVPKGPEHGRAVDTTNYLYGARINIICDDGFRLYGRPFIQCMLKGDQLEWSNLPTCQAIPCLPPPDIPHGSHTGQSEQEFSFGSAVTYKCDQGFSLIGEATIHCTTKDHDNGEWSGPAPECKGIECKPLELENGRVHFTDLRFGATANFSCNEGYRLNGPTSAQCVVAGNGVDWNKEVSLCEAIPCLPPPDITHGSHTGQTIQEFSFGSAVTYKCDQGFSLIGDASIHCTTKDHVNGEWSGPAPECKEMECKPLELENGRVHFTDLRFGATANFSCNEGYRLIGTTSAQCVVAGNGVHWDKEVPLCEEIPCRPPPDIPHGSHTGQSEQEFSFGSVVTYKCDQGFSLIGEASIHCTTKDHVNGEWSGPAPECKAQCVPHQRRRRDIPPDTNGREVKYRCSDGSVKNPGKSDTLCLSNSEWSTIGDFCGWPGIDTHFGIARIGLGIGLGIAIIAGIAIGTLAVLNKKWQKKKGSYGVNLDSRKHHITTEHDLEMNETKSNLISKV